MFPAVESAGTSVILSRFPGVGPVWIDSRDGYFRFSLDPEWAGGDFSLPAFLRPYEAQMGCPENLSSAPRKSFCVPQRGLLDVFCPLNPIPGADYAPSGGGRSMLRAVLATDAVLLQGVSQRLPDRMPVRGMGARAFSPAGLCAMIPPGGYGDAGRGLYIKEAATLPFRNVTAVWALRPVVRLSLSVRSRRCSAGCCCVRRRRRHSNCRSVPLRPPRRRAGSQRSRSPSAVRSRRPKPRSSSSCPSTAGARTRRRPPLPT